MSLENYQYKGQAESKRRPTRTRNSRESAADSIRQESSENECDQEIYGKQESGKKTIGKKRKTKPEQNEGLRIAKQKKIEYLFRNICNPEGSITIQSLCRALGKHRIEFSLPQLQQMMALCGCDQLEEDGPGQEISEKLQEAKVNYTAFRQFYLSKF